MARKNLAVVQRQPEAQKDSPERFARLTSHLRVNGQPLESKLFLIQAEKDTRS